MSNKFGIWMIRALAVMLIGALVFIIGINATFARVKKVNISKEDEDLGISKSEYTPGSQPGEKDENPIDDVCEHDYDKIINIALFGGDARGKNVVTHTDAAIVLTIDTVHRKLKLSSIMRDTYVDVHGHGRTKFNHAYSYGGPELAIRTLNENFSLNIRDYVFIDFLGLEKLVDALGGVEIDIKKKEISEVNKFIEEMAQIKGVKPHFLKSPGLQNLKGEQALSYSRIRYVGDGDFERTDRQRRVMEELLHKVRDAGPIKFPSLISNLLPFVETSLGEARILKLGAAIFTSGITDIEQQRFPMDGYCKGEIIDKVWYLVSDLPATTEQMHMFIYHDTMPIQ